MSTATPRSFVTLSAFVVTLLVSSAASAAAPVTAKPSTQPAATGALASYIFVCRDARGNLDRRACHHMGRLDPQRVTIAMR